MKNKYYYIKPIKDNLNSHFDIIDNKIHQIITNKINNYVENQVWNRVRSITYNQCWSSLLITYKDFIHYEK
jgi:hypothetical protein